MQGDYVFFEFIELCDGQCCLQLLLGNGHADPLTSHIEKDSR